MYLARFPRAPLFTSPRSQARPTLAPLLSLRLCSTNPSNPTSLVICESEGRHRRRYELSSTGAEWKIVHERLQDEEVTVALDPRDDVLSRLPAPVKRMLRYFLPAGFPASVTPDYIHYVKWLFLENTLSSMLYVLSMTAMMASVNVASSSVGIAAGVSWVLKDGLGAVGMILSSNLLSARFDADAKRTRWRADVLQNVGVGLELLTTFFPTAFLILGSVANVLKGVAGLTSGACRASINASMAKADNLGDVTAKLAAQGMLSYVLGTACGVALSLKLTGAGLGPLYAVFSVLAALHLFCSYRSLRNLRFSFLNAQRTHILVKQYLATLPAPQVETPTELQWNGRELIILTPEWDKVWPIRLGVSISEAFPSPRALTAALKRYGSGAYLISVHRRAIRVVLREDLEPHALLRAFVHAVILRHCLIRHGIGKTDDTPLEVAEDEAEEIMEKEYAALITTLLEKGWDLDVIVLAPYAARATWTHEEAS